jgi:hypothetical protein
MARRYRQIPSGINQLLFDSRAKHGDSVAKPATAPVLVSTTWAGLGWGRFSSGVWL